MRTSPFEGGRGMFSGFYTPHPPSREEFKQEQEFL